MELFTPDLGLVFWMFIAFLLLFLILAKFAWPVITKNMEERADAIDKGVEYARQAKEQLDNARSEAQKYVAEAQKQQATILREASQMKSQIIEEARSEAQQAAKKEHEDAKRAIAQERKEAEKQFKDDVSRFSLEIAEKMMRERMKDDNAQTVLVNKLLKEIEAN